MLACWIDSLTLKMCFLKKCPQKQVEMKQTNKKQVEMKAWRKSKHMSRDRKLESQVFSTLLIHGSPLRCLLYLHTPNIIVYCVFYLY